MNDNCIGYNIQGIVVSNERKFSEYGVNIV